MKVCLTNFPQTYQIIKIQNFKISRNVKLQEVYMMMITNIPPLLFVDQIAIGYSVLCERDQLLVYWDIHGKTSCPNLPSAQCFVQIPFDFPASTISKTLHEIPIQVYFIFTMVFSRFSRSVTWTKCSLFVGCSEAAETIERPLPSLVWAHFGFSITELLDSLLSNPSQFFPFRRLFSIPLFSVPN